jgi:deazaflavin-dependent oxidoreductase (nitroreductase family)
VPLVYVEADRDGIVVVATNWGTKSHPGWSYNLDAEPRTSYLIDGSETTAAARRASADEFALYWGRFVERWPNYDGYRRRLQREVRMYVLTPQPA